MLFVAKHLNRESVHGLRVLEVGARGFGVRPLIDSWGPAQYVGIDLQPGPGVNIVHSAENLLGVFESDSFDVVLSTETLEHVRDWRMVLLGIKSVTKPGGIVVLTTRSQGYPFHAAPHDYWRYECEDMKSLFSDFTDVSIEADSQEPGVFVAATKPKSGYVPLDLNDFQLYSMVSGCRTQVVPLGPVGRWRATQLVWAGRIRQSSKAIFETLKGRPPGLRFQVDPGGSTSRRSKRQ